MRKDPADAPVRGAVTEPAYPDHRTPCRLGFVTLVEEPGGCDGSDRRKVERDENALGERSWVRELVLEWDRMPGLVPGVYRDDTTEDGGT